MVAFAFDVDDELIDRLPDARLPRHWRTSRGLLVTQGIGDEWLASGRTLALAVPSAIVPEESNYLLNPAHAGFGRLRFGRPVPFLLDPRLVG
jgi:RES domain-containing protein